MNDPVKKRPNFAVLATVSATHAARAGNSSENLNSTKMLHKTALILLVAAFNMIGALTMLVLEKQKDIAVLKAMGAHENNW